MIKVDAYITVRIDGEPRDEIIPIFVPGIKYYYPTTIAQCGKESP
jgi:hypothetical protein